MIDSIWSVAKSARGMTRTVRRAKNGSSSDTWEMNRSQSSPCDSTARWMPARCPWGWISRITEVRSLRLMLSCLRSMRVRSTSLRSQTVVAPLVAKVRSTRPRSSMVSPDCCGIGSRLGLKKVSKTRSRTWARAAS